MNTLQEDYNTQREPLNISEYGRIIQDYVTHLQTLPSKDERTRWVSGLVEVMTTLNPNLKQQTDYEKVLWGYVHQISGFRLDVDAPFPLPTKEEKAEKPGQIGYFDSVIRFRFYGRNLQNMIEEAASIEDEELRQDLVDLIASFMYNSCKIWNNENLSNEVIAEHMKILSKGKLSPSAEELTVSADASKNFTPKPKCRNFGRKNNNKNKGRRNRRY